METQINILFHVRKDKKANNLFPIYLRATINGKRFGYSTRHYVELEKWSPVLGKVKGKRGETKKINDHLEVLTEDEVIKNNDKTGKTFPCLFYL